MLTQTIRLAVTTCLLLALPAQESAGKPGRSPSHDSEAQEPSGTSKVDKDREEVSVLLHELEATLEQMSQAQIQVTNVRKIVDKLDEGAVKASEKELVKTNQFVRQKLAKGFRELRARARSVVTQVNTVVLPSQRGVATKLRTRWELETDEAVKTKIATLLGEYEQTMAETTGQIERLEGNIQSLSGAIQILEKQLSYLALVEESLGLSRQVSDQLRQLNQEIDKVVTALAEKEIRQ